MKKCKVKNCKNKYYGKGYCQRHYLQLKNYGKILKRIPWDPNEIVDCGDYCEIILYVGRKEQKEIARTKIDKNDLDKVKNYKWSLTGGGYVKTRVNKKDYLLHQLILGRKEGFETDHINHDKLDNRKCNLRLVTRSQNNLNRIGTRGIYWSKQSKNWYVQIGFNYKTRHLGCYKDINEAIEVREKAEKKLIINKNLWEAFQKKFQRLP